MSAAVKLAREQQPDLVLLDLMIPGIDGLEVCRQLKSQSETAWIPVIMLTAKGEEVDVVAGLELGADDYVGKPFRMRLLLARIRAVLRRATGVEVVTPRVTRIESLVINDERHEVSVDGKPLVLTLTEYKLLRFLAQELGISFVDLEKVQANKDFLKQFPAKVLLDGHILPLAGENGDTLVVIHDPFDTSAVDQLRLATGLRFKIGLAPLNEIDRQVKRFLGVGADTVQSLISEAGEQFQILDASMDEDMDLSEAAAGASIRDP